MRTYSRCWWSSLVLLVVITALAGCATETGATCPRPTANTSTDTVATTTFATTYTHGSVLLTTDHSIYAPGEPVEVALANHLMTTLYAPVPADCPFFALQRQVGSAWQTVPDCPSPASSHGDLGPSNAQMVFIDVGETATDLILDDDVPPDTYRIMGAFVEPPASGGEDVVAYSAPIRFCTCAQCS